MAPTPQEDRRERPSEEALPSLVDLKPGTANLLPRYIKAEANLLRLPLFSLQTKGLGELDAIECRGEIKGDEFFLRVSRNTATPYPGTLSRAAHLAFLSIATARGFPVENPITWTWYDLCKRMGISYSGKTVTLLKTAIESTAGLMIKSQYAIYSKTERRKLCDRDEVLHLYESVTFVGTKLPDGSTVDTNYLSFAKWYLDNLNALYTAPLDYELWRRLDKESVIASRLYEYLFLNFYRTPVLTINYRNLADRLPVQREIYRSQARQQLDPAFALLKTKGVIKRVEWADSKSDIALLHISPGPRITTPRSQQELPFQPIVEDELEGSFEVRQIRVPVAPEWSLVTEFYRLWQGSEHKQPTKKELELARSLIDQYGTKKAKDLIRRVVKTLKLEWPKAKTFAAVGSYIDDAVKALESAERQVEREQNERQEREREARRRQIEDAKYEELKSVWEALSECERSEIRDAVLRDQPYLRLHPDKHPGLIQRFCLTELARRRGEEPSVDRE